MLKYLGVILDRAAVPTRFATPGLGLACHIGDLNNVPEGAMSEAMLALATAGILLEFMDGEVFD